MVRQDSNIEAVLSPEKDQVAVQQQPAEYDEKHIGNGAHEVGLELYQEGYGLDTNGPEAKAV